MDESKTASDLSHLSDLLHRAEAFDNALIVAIGGTDYQPYNSSDRVTAAISAASVAWEHARAARMLAEARAFTTALAAVRLAA